MHYITAVFACLSFFLFAAMAGAADMGPTLKKACTACHSAKRICLNLGVKSPGAWKGTVSKMVAKGAKLDAGQIDAATGYLAGLAPGSGPLCK
ncbi:hypothetical protein GM415_10440 [Pseudodesulfovibrio cashew]|uniref:Cytochrome c domain-containing protein n=2 Tax=Pseudodesulfovibrio cashew TaxID=2678688 RepID=A0A6I6JLG3_9BACT|nr:hypothetical protein GM415_10440 [Pseudodesulfovibrio cashew]